MCWTMRIICIWLMILVCLNALTMAIQDGSIGSSDIMACNNPFDKDCVMLNKLRRMEQQLIGLNSKINNLYKNDDEKTAVKENTKRYSTIDKFKSK